MRAHRSNQHRYVAGQKEVHPSYRRFNARGSVTRGLYRDTAAGEDRARSADNRCCNGKAKREVARRGEGQQRGSGGQSRGSGRLLCASAEGISGDKLRGDDKGHPRAAEGP